MHGWVGEWMRGQKVGHEKGIEVEGFTFSSSLIRLRWIVPSCPYPQLLSCQRLSPVREHTTAEAFWDSPLNTWIPAPSPTVLTPGLTGTLRPSSWFPFSFLALVALPSHPPPQGSHPSSTPCPRPALSSPPSLLPSLDLSPKRPWLPCFTAAVQFSPSVVSDSLRPHGLQLARPPCPSLTPGACSNSCPSSRWCHPSHPLSSSSPAAFNLSQHQGLFQGVSPSHQVARVLEFQLQHQSF